LLSAKMRMEVRWIDEF